MEKKPTSRYKKLAVALCIGGALIALGQFFEGGGSSATVVVDTRGADGQVTGLEVEILDEARGEVLGVFRKAFSAGQSGVRFEQKGPDGSYTLVARVRFADGKTRVVRRDIELLDGATVEVRIGRDLRGTVRL